jgi:hypothetical protein
MRRALLLAFLLSVIGCKSGEEKYCARAVPLRFYPPPTPEKSCVEDYRRFTPSQRACADACARSERTWLSGEG